ncbi:MAG TPA: carboxypeptidase-like regulatory domain-containing protein, partial [Chthoniobacterales bacterium]|nr:carboxypeptidase-like regulatory domain-containing protein [Chthoniobacterales bacterium]
PEVKPQSYAEYPLIILSQAEKKEIAHVTADENGNYRVGLPPGNYVLGIQDGMAKHVRAAPRPFTVVSNQTVHVDMNIIIGMHQHL